MPRGTPTAVIRLPVDLLERIDADLERSKKTSRTQWLTDLSTALLDGRIQNTPKPMPNIGWREPTETAPDAARSIGYAKTQQTKRKATP